MFDLVLVVIVVVLKVCQSGSSTWGMAVLVWIELGIVFFVNGL